jgi:hypothetical protein
MTLGTTYITKQGFLGYFGHGDLGDNLRMHKLGADAAAATAQLQRTRESSTGSQYARTEQHNTNHHDHYEHTIKPHNKHYRIVTLNQCPLVKLAAVKAQHPTSFPRNRKYEELMMRAMLRPLHQRFGPLLDTL